MESTAKYDTLEVERDDDTSNKVLTRKELAKELKKARKLAEEEKKRKDKIKRQRLVQLLKDLDGVMYAVLHKKYIEDTDTQNRMINSAREGKRMLSEYIPLNSGTLHVAVQQIIELIGTKPRSIVLQDFIFNRVYDLRGFTVREKIEKEFRDKYGIDCNIGLTNNYENIVIMIMLFGSSSSSNKCIVQ